MKNATDEIISALKTHGYRITEARKKIIERLAAQAQPVSVRELSRSLPGTDEASVYRTVRTLLEEELLEEIRVLGELPKYALSLGHHHHAVCTSCGVMVHITCTPPQTAVPASFKTITAHEVTLYGMCRKCG